jgi:hypothetical protein
MVTPEDKKRRRSGLSGAALFFLWALLLLLMARRAELQHTVISGSYKHGWMTPLQAYTAAVLFIALAAYSLFLGFRQP